MDMEGKGGLGGGGCLATLRCKRAKSRCITQIEFLPDATEMLPAVSSVVQFGAACRRARKIVSSYGVLRRTALVRTDVSEEHSASVIKVTRISELGKLAVTSNRRTLCYR
jgi:hypothetical protein